MALAAAQHHSAPKSAGPVSHNVLRNQNTAREGTEFYAMSEDSDVVGGGRPPSLVDVRPQVRLQQRTVKQIVDLVPLVPLLHDVVPQMVEQLVEVATTPGYAFAVVAVQTMGWPAARALFEELTASPGRDTNTGQG